VTVRAFPSLEPEAIAATRDALHAYSRVPGSWLEACRRRRKHWWHISLRPSLRGLSTGPVHTSIHFELELDLRNSLLRGEVAGGGELVEALDGRPAAALAEKVEEFLVAEGIAATPDTESPDAAVAAEHPGYSPAAATSIADAWLSVARALTRLRAETPEETSPIQLWPHHFDLSMLWLPGEKIPGQDPADAEYSDKQINIGFTLGDPGITEPYFYLTAHPLPAGFPALSLPTGSAWQSEGFSGVVTLYRDVAGRAEPENYLLDLWRGLLQAGREQMLSGSNTSQ
jgi:hypothetical protein